MTKMLTYNIVAFQLFDIFFNLNYKVAMKNQQFSYN